MNIFPLGMFNLLSRCVLSFWDLQAGDVGNDKLALLQSVSQFLVASLWIWFYPRALPAKQLLLYIHLEDAWCQVPSFSNNFCLASAQTCIENVTVKALPLAVAFGLAILFTKTKNMINRILLVPNFIPQRNRFQGDWFEEQMHTSSQEQHLNSCDSSNRAITFHIWF